jgi:hypothetical protein
LVHELIYKQFRVRLSVVSVGRLLRTLGFSPQRPVLRASQQDPQRVRDWRRREYPAIRDEACGAENRVTVADQHFRGRTTTSSTSGVIVESPADGYSAWEDDGDAKRLAAGVTAFAVALVLLLVDAISLRDVADGRGVNPVTLTTAIGTRTAARCSSGSPSVGRGRRGGGSPTPTSSSPRSRAGSATASRASSSAASAPRAA